MAMGQSANAFKTEMEKMERKKEIMEERKAKRNGEEF